MSFLRGFLRVYSWVFESILCLMAIAIGMVSLVIGADDLQLGWLPWTGKALLVWLIVLGLLGLFFVLLAVQGKLRILLFLFSLGVVILLIRGFFLGPYAFAGPDQAEHAVILVMGSLLAVAGAWPMTPPPARRW